MTPKLVAIAQLCMPGIQPITLVSVYGVMDGSAVSTMLRVRDDGRAHRGEILYV